MEERSEREAIEADLREAVERSVPRGESREVYEYALFPTGGLVRARLVRARAMDGSGLTRNHRLLAAAVEVHHAYTLVHDDLPCMDDDDERRGRPSAHRRFGEWRALLAGDGLLNLSYGILGGVAHRNAGLLLRLFARCAGPKGLVQGQYDDLLRRGPAGPAALLSTYELKTARLFQCALVGAAVLDGPGGAPWRERLDAARAGRDLGVLFQLLDDLAGRVRRQRGPPPAGGGGREAAIDPWGASFQECLGECRARVRALGPRMGPGVEGVLTDWLLDARGGLGGGAT